MKRSLVIASIVAALALVIAGLAIPTFAQNPDTNNGEGENWEEMRQACSDMMDDMGDMDGMMAEMDEMMEDMDGMMGGGMMGNQSGFRNGMGGGMMGGGMMGGR